MYEIINFVIVEDVLQANKKQRKKISKHCNVDKCHEISNLSIIIESQDNQGDSDANTEGYSLWSIVYLIAILMWCLFFSSPILLIPQHNAIKNPEYWYESMLVGALSCFLSITLETVIFIWGYLEIASMCSMRVFLKLYLPTITLWMLIFSVENLIWTFGIGYNFPMPFSQYPGLLAWFFQYMLLYYIIPKPLMRNKKMKGKFRAFVIGRVFGGLMDFQFKGLTYLFSIVPLDTQWTLAILIPLCREINYKLIHSTMISSPKSHNGYHIVVMSVNAYTALFVAITLGQQATQMTLILVLSLDFILNLHGCYQIVHLYTSITPKDEDAQLNSKVKEYLLHKLIYTEMMESLVPLLYVITVLIAYYGPNSQILGNIGNDYWHYERIDDIGNFGKIELLMCLIDSCSAIIVGVWLWKSCAVDFLREGCKLIKDFWLAAAVIITNYLNIVSNSMM